MTLQDMLVEIQQFYCRCAQISQLGKLHNNKCRHCFVTLNHPMLIHTMFEEQLIETCQKLCGSVHNFHLTPKGEDTLLVLEQLNPSYPIYRREYIMDGIAT